MTSNVRHLNLLRWSLATIVAAVMLLAPSLSGGAPSSNDGLDAYFDPADTTTSPLDLFGVRFGQTAGTDLSLVIRTHKAWDSTVVNPQTGGTLCILLRSDVQANPAGRLCVYPSPSGAAGLALRYTPLDQNGKQLGIRDLTPVVVRPNDTTVRVSFPPALLRLKPGLYHWKARSQFRDDAKCLAPAGCEDLLPNTGEHELNITLAVSPAARQRCFGAASLDVQRPCRNPRLARAVVPTPEVAVTTPNLPCAPLRQVGLIVPCEFGVPAAKARNTVALIGDSHAAHWRSALEIAAQEFGWRGLSVTRSGCPLTRATARLDPTSRRRQCVSWNEQVPRWLARNPQISTVFVVAHFDATIVVKDGQDQFSAKMSGFARAWKALPPSVKRVIVIRDTPKSKTNTLSCVSRAVARRKAPGRACALPREIAIDRDAAASAATRMRSSRIKKIDMTSFFCSRSQCFPVIGGALVYKDVSHLTDVFASSLGPFLVRKIRGLSAR